MMNGYQRYVKEPDHEPKKTPPPKYIYRMANGWYTVCLPDRWVGVFFGLEKAQQAKVKALHER
jgi:hypothetical protein